jgi:hypothetical protein
MTSLFLDITPYSPVKVCLCFRWGGEVKLVGLCCVYFDNGVTPSCRQISGIILENDLYNCYSISITTLLVKFN